MYASPNRFWIERHWNIWKHSMIQTLLRYQFYNRLKWHFTGIKWMYLYLLLHTRTRRSGSILLWLCPSVGWLVGPSLSPSVRPSVSHSKACPIANLWSSNLTVRLYITSMWLLVRHLLTLLILYSVQLTHSVTQFRQENTYLYNYRFNIFLLRNITTYVQDQG